MVALEEVVVPPEAPMPDGYGFLKKGSLMATGMCRRKTLLQQQTLYVVCSEGTEIGLRAPVQVLAEVFEERRARLLRGVADKFDSGARLEFRNAVLAQFPRIPQRDLDVLVNQALRRSGRLWRTSKEALHNKVRRAVAARIKLRHTNSRDIMRQYMAPELASGLVQQAVLHVMLEWGMQPRADMNPTPWHPGLQPQDGDAMAVDTAEPNEDCDVEMAECGGLMSHLSL